MRYLISSLLLLGALLFSTAVMADAPYPGYSRIRYDERAYERQLRRDFAAFRAEKARERRRAELARKRRLERTYVREERLNREEREYRRWRAERRDRRAMRRAAVEREVYQAAPVVRRGATCQRSMTGWGVERLGRGRAEESAQKRWESQVTYEYGRSYANVDRARNPRMLCDPSCKSCLRKYYQCKFIAAPCRATNLSDEEL